MQVIGLCRFSYPAIGGFQVEHDRIEDRIAWLYAPERLEERFRLFEAITLPALRAQTDGDFTFLVVIGDSLPEPSRARLRRLLADLPQARIVSQPPRPQREVMKELLNAARDDPDRPCCQFRLDDDDAVAVDFVARLHQAAADCAPLAARHRSVAFDFCRGYIAKADAQGISATEVVRPFQTAALAMWIKRRNRQTIMNFAHNKLGLHMPCVSFSDAPMFVRTHNGFNDARQKKARPQPVTLLSEAEAAVFLDRFAIDADHVANVFQGAA